MVGTTLGDGAGVVGSCDAMDLVIRMFGGGLLSTLGTGCTLGLGWVSSLSSWAASSFSIRLSRQLRRRMVGLDASHSLSFAALVLAAGGALSCAAALVCDLVLRAGAVGGTGAGVDSMRRFRLVTSIDVVGN